MLTKHSLYVRSASGLKLRDRKVQRLVRAMRVAMPWLEDSDVPACRAWAQLEILSDQAFAILRMIGIIDRQGNPKRLLTDFRQLRQAQLAYERELGMTPQARMQLKANNTRAALDLAESVSERAVKIAEERAETVVETGNDMLVVDAEVANGAADNKGHCDKSD
jgi:hypothetical protein